jgi:hypothetical protein
MRKHYVSTLSLLLILISWISMAYALEEKDKTVIYQVTIHSNAGDLISYTAYTIATQEKTGYWLQRTTATQPDSKPLSITQTLLDNTTHKPLRYIMHRPANMNRLENVIDFPLEQMGTDEVLPTPITADFADAGRIQVAAGTFEVQQAHIGGQTLWVNPDVPVLGVVKAETADWTMELVRIDPQAIDLLPKKPQKGGIVYLNEE